MDHKSTVTVPEEVYDKQEAEERFARHIGDWDSGHQNSAGNDRIDIDLAREYANCEMEEL
jgi:hypothetical protein